MLLSDRQIIEKYHIRPSDKILDVGGSMKQHLELGVNTLVDIIRPEEAPYKEEKLLAKNFVRLDITKEKFPFKDNEFDFCLCSHTLEDLSYPFLAIEEMSRVAKRGLIITPSFGSDIVFSPVNFTDWLTGARRVPGFAHHKWLFYEEERGVLRIVPKNYPVLYSSEFHITGWKGKEEVEHYWEGEINYKEVKDLSMHKLINEYRRYVKKNKDKIKKGLVLFYFDSPFNYLKGLVGVLTKRGAGYTYGKRP